MTITHSNQSRRALLQDVLVGVSLLALAAILGFLSPDYISPELEQRLLFVAIGAVGAFYANVAAKKLTPLAQMRGDPVAEQALRRFTAWSLTLGGLGYSLAWIFVPLSIAPVVAVALLGASVLLVITRWMWTKTKGPHA